MEEKNDWRSCEAMTLAAEWLEQRALVCGTYAATTAREWAAELRKEGALKSSDLAADEIKHMKQEWNEECKMTTQRTGLVDQVQATIEAYRSNAPIGGELVIRTLAVSIVRVFRDYIEAEILKPDIYDTEQPSKGQGWE